MMNTKFLTRTVFKSQYVLKHGSLEIGKFMTISCSPNITSKVISHKLSEGDMKSLDGLVTNDIIPSLHKALSVMSMSQREQLAIAADDIYFSFPYQVGIIFNDDEGKDQKRFVEITMVYHILRGLSDMRARGEEPPINMGMVPEYQTRISICNYRFIREFTKGIEGQWTVNLLNHFKPSDYIN